MVATLAVILTLVVPAGFGEARTLEPAVSYVAGSHVAVYCSTTPLDWRNFMRSPMATRAAHGAVAVTMKDASGYSVLIHTQFCDPLRDRLANRKVPNVVNFADALLTLTHEAVHARGIVDEGVTECSAIHLMPGVAVRYFHVTPGKPLRALMAQAWTFHRSQPPEYQSVC